MYAVGEIILVMIGILLALQVNNWNEYSKARMLEEEYYCRFLEDLNNDQLELEQFKEDAGVRLAAANNAARIIIKKTVNKTEIGGAINLCIRRINADFIINSSAFEDLKSGANMNIIRDKSLINAMSSYHQKVAAQVKVIRASSDWALDIFYSNRDWFKTGSFHAFMKEGRMKDGMDPDVFNSLTPDYNELLSEEQRKLLMNDIVWYISIHSRHLELYGSIQEEIEKLKIILEMKCTEK